MISSDLISGISPVRDLHSNLVSCWASISSRVLRRSSPILHPANQQYATPSGGCTSGISAAWAEVRGLATDFLGWTTFALKPFTIANRAVESLTPWMIGLLH